MNNTFIKTLPFMLSTLFVINNDLFAKEFDKKDTQHLEQVTITANETSKYLSKEKPLINRTNIVDMQDTAKSIQIFNEDFIKDASFQNIEDIIKMSSNTTYSGDSHGRTNQIAIRGFKNVPIIFDGMRITNKLPHPEVFNLQALEVLKGPDSIQYGQSSPGGLVNLVNKKPVKNSLALIEFQVNDNPSFSPKIDLGGSINNDRTLYFRLNSVLNYDKGWTNSNTKIKKFFIAPSLSYEINDNNILTFISQYSKEQKPSAFGTFVDKNGKLVTDIKNILSHPDEKLEQKQTILGFDLDSVFDTFNSSLRYRYIDYTTDNGSGHLPNLGYKEATHSINRFYAYQKQDFSEHALQYTLNKEFNLFNFNNRLSLGADYNKAYTTTTFFHKMRTSSYPLGLNTLKYEKLTNLSDHLDAVNFSRPKTYVENYGIFLQENIDLSEDLIFSLGLRYDEVKPKDSDKSDALTPQFGLIYHLNQETTLFANYSESFTPNTFRDKNKKVLDPEEGKGFELGIKQKFLDDNLSLSASVFKIKKENVATLDLANSTGIYVYTASGLQKSQGFELDLSGQITSNLSLVASYGFSSTKDKEINDNKLVNIPSHTANIFATYYLSSFDLPNFYIGGSARFLGSRYADNKNKIKLDSEVIYSANFGYKKGNLTAGLSIQNLSNEKYLEGVMNAKPNWARGYAGTPRTILATISYKF